MTRKREKENTMIRSEYYTLSNGVQIPRLGLDT